MTPTAAAPRAPFLVMAHHRSGSNFLNDLLQAHPQLECLNEPLSMHTDFFRCRDLELWRGGDYEPGHLHPSLAADPQLREFLVDFRDYLLQSNDRRVVGFKETVLFGKLGWIKAFLPPLKVLLLVRDPYAVVSSVLRTRLLPFWNYARFVPAFAALHPGYRCQGASADPGVQAAEVVAMSVAVRHDLARRSLGQFDHLEVRLADLMRDPEPVLSAIAGFLEVEPDGSPLAFARHRQAETRGGLFSSFRAADDVENTWRRDLAPEQVRVVSDVLSCA